MDFFDYFETTTFIFFWSLFLARGIQLRLHGVNPFVLGVQRKSIKGTLEKIFLIGFRVLTAELISHSLKLGIHIFPQRWHVNLFSIIPLRIAGVTLSVIALAIFVSALISFGHSWRVGIDRIHPGELVTTGIFALTRNPIYLFLDLYFFSVWLIYSNLFFLFFALIIILVNHHLIRQEEQFLLKQYGEEYRNYLRKVRQYF